MVKERNYIVETLKSSGIKSQVYTNMKKLKQGNEVHVGAVLRNGETFTRSGSKRKFVDQEGRRKRRVKLWDRNTSLHVVIADTSEEKVEEILEEFLRNLKKGIDVDGNWVNIVVGEADWVEEGDSILKEKESSKITKETHTTERWGREGGTTIHQISFTVDISKIKDLPLLYKLIDELKDAQNRTDSSSLAAT